MNNNASGAYRRRRGAPADQREWPLRQVRFWLLETQIVAAQAGTPIDRWVEVAGAVEAEDECLLATAYKHATKR